MTKDVNLIINDLSNYETIFQALKEAEIRGVFFLLKKLQMEKYHIEICCLR